ncbi:MAG: UDP-N-acetylmuramate dehydrogenase [Patescibacteria group bacterium]
MNDKPRGLREGVLLAPYSTYQIGGKADFLVEVETVEELQSVIGWAKQEGIKYFVVGTGANLLFLDEGYRGLVIANRAKKFVIDGEVLEAGSGAVVADIIKATVPVGLSGFEHFIGIPSTIGGAIWQNLHFLSPDRESTLYLGDILIDAKVLMENGEVETVDKDFFEFGYDTSVLHSRKIYVLSARFQLAPSSPEEMQKIVDANWEWRTARQPQLDEYPSCGSVFKKIEGVGAGRLIDQVGLKGKTIGGAQISSKHANYIVNLGGAKASDVLALAKLAQDAVKEELGYELEMEITVVR